MLAGRFMLVQSPQRHESNIFYYRLYVLPQKILYLMSFYVEITIKHYFFRHFTGLLIGPDTLLVWYFLDKNKLFDHSRSRLNKIPNFSLNSFPKYWYFDFYQIECYASPSKWLISLTMQWFCDKTKVTRFNERRHSFCCLDFQFRSAHIQFRAEHGLDNISVCIFSSSYETKNWTKL